MLQSPITLHFCYHIQSTHHFLSLPIYSMHISWLNATSNRGLDLESHLLKVTQRMLAYIPHKSCFSQAEDHSIFFVQIGLYSALVWTLRIYCGTNAWSKTLCIALQAPLLKCIEIMMGIVLVIPSSAQTLSEMLHNLLPYIRVNVFFSYFCHHHLSSVFLTPQLQPNDHLTHHACSIITCHNP